MVPDSVPGKKLTLAGFLSKVAAANLDYAAKPYNVSIARALIAAAKVSPNPTVTLGYKTADQNQPSIYSGAKRSKWVESGTVGLQLRKGIF